MCGLCCKKHVNGFFLIVSEVNKFDLRYSRHVAAPPFVQCNVFALIYLSLYYRIHNSQCMIFFFFFKFLMRAYVADIVVAYFSCITNLCTGL
jgi:hypothetical protein